MLHILAMLLVPAYPICMGSVSNHHQIANIAEIITCVREGDYDYFLAIQLAPKAKRSALYALTAFHIEIAGIADKVSAPIFGHMRLAWWREAVAEMVAGKAARQHPVTLALAPLLNEQPILADSLYAMLDARAMDVENAPLTNEAAWQSYADATVGALHHAWARVLDRKAAVQLALVIRNQARTCAMIGLLKDIPRVRAYGAACFQAELLTWHGIVSPAATPQRNAMVLALIKQASVCAVDARLGRLLRPLDGVMVLHRYAGSRLQRAEGNPYQLRLCKLTKVWMILKLTDL